MAARSSNVARERVDRELAERLAQPSRRLRVRRDGHVGAPVVVDDRAQPLGRERGTGRSGDPCVDDRRWLPGDVDRAERRRERHPGPLADRERVAVAADDVDDGDGVVDDARRGHREPGLSREERQLAARGADLGERCARGRTQRDESRAQGVGPAVGLAHDVPGVGEREEDRVTRRLAEAGVAGEVGEPQPLAAAGAERLEDPHDPLGGVRPLTGHLLEY
jgi:hypothetical protein